MPYAKMMSPIKHLTKALQASHQKIESYEKIKRTANKGNGVFLKKVSKYDAFRQT